MSKREILSLAIKITGIYQFILSLNQMGFSLWTIDMMLEGKGFDWMRLIAFIAVWPCVAILLLLIIFKSDYLAGKFYPREERRGRGSSLNTPEIYVLVITTLGLYLMINGLAQVFYMIAMAMQYLVPMSVPEQSQLREAVAWKWLVTPAVKFLLGLLMVLRPHGIYRLLLRVRDK